MTDKKTRSEIKRYAAMAIQWTAFADRAADEGHLMDAAQHLKRSNECVLKANQLKQKLAAD